MLIIKQLPVLTDNYIYLIHEPNSGATAVVDPAIAEPVITALNQQDWQLTHLFNTHHHWDHVGANLELKELYHCSIYGSSYDSHRIPGIDHTLDQGDVITFGQSQAQIIATPGHTLGHIVYYFDQDDALFCGDTLFVMGCGRLFEGSAEQMYQSLQKITALPADTQIYCTHEYTQANGQFALTIEPDNLDLQSTMRSVNSLRSLNQPTVPSTLAQELKTNPFLRANSPAIHATLALQNHSDIEVFTEIRKRKDTF